MKIHKLTTKHDNSRVDHKTWQFISWPQNMKIHELTTKHENSRVDYKKFTSSPQNKQRKVNLDKPVVYVMRNFAIVTNFSLLNSRVVQRKRNKTVRTNQNKDLHKTQIRTAEENQTRIGNIRQRNIERMQECRHLNTTITMMSTM